MFIIIVQACAYRTGSQPQTFLKCTARQPRAGTDATQAVQQQSRCITASCTKGWAVRAHCSALTGRCYNSVDGAADPWPRCPASTAHNFCSNALHLAASGCQQTYSRLRSCLWWHRRALTLLPKRCSPRHLQPRNPLPQRLPEPPRPKRDHPSRHHEQHPQPSTGRLVSPHASQSWADDADSQQASHHAYKAVKSRASTKLVARIIGSSTACR